MRPFPFCQMSRQHLALNLNFRCYTTIPICTAFLPLAVEAAACLRRRLRPPPMSRIPSCPIHVRTLPSHLRSHPQVSPRFPLFRVTHQQQTISPANVLTYKKPHSCRHFLHLPDSLTLFVAKSLERAAYTSVSQVS